MRRQTLVRTAGIQKTTSKFRRALRKAFEFPKNLLKHPMRTLSSVAVGVAVGSMLLFTPACLRNPAPSITSRGSEVDNPSGSDFSMCNEPRLVGFDNTGTHMIIFDQGERRILNNDYSLEYVGTNPKGDAVFNLIDMHSDKTVRVYMLETNTDYEIRDGNGELLLRFAVCLVGDSVTIAADRELGLEDPKIKAEQPSDGGIADAETADETIIEPGEGCDSTLECSDLSLIPEDETWCITNSRIDYTITYSVTYFDDGKRIGCDITVSDDDGRGLPIEAQDNAMHLPFLPDSHRYNVFTVIDETSFELVELVDYATLSFGDYDFVEPYLDIGCDRRVVLGSISGGSNPSASLIFLDEDGETIRRSQTVHPGDFFSVEISGETVWIKVLEIEDYGSVGGPWMDILSGSQRTVVHSGRTPQAHLSSGETVDWTGWTASVSTNLAGELTGVSLSAPMGTTIPDCRPIVE